MILLPVEGLVKVMRAAFRTNRTR